MTSNKKVLIVEDEILIADTLKRYLETKDYEVVGIAISYEEAIDLIDDRQPEIILLDIRLNGPKTGIDVAKYLRNFHLDIPFIYLTSQIDQQSLEEAKATFPAGYLTKPVQKLSLFTSMEMILHNSSSALNRVPESILLKENDTNYNIAYSDILFIRAEHVYLIVYLKNGKRITVRNSLIWILEQLPTDVFVQVHRSYVVNIKHVNEWNSNVIFVGENEIPISRGRKKATFSLLEVK